MKKRTVVGRLQDQLAKAVMMRQDLVDHEPWRSGSRDVGRRAGLVLRRGGWHRGARVRVGRRKDELRRRLAAGGASWRPRRQRQGLWQVCGEQGAPA